MEKIKSIQKRTQTSIFELWLTRMLLSYLQLQYLTSSCQPELPINRDGNSPVRDCAHRVPPRAKSLPQEGDFEVYPLYGYLDHGAGLMQLTC